MAPTSMVQEVGCLWAECRRNRVPIWRHRHFLFTCSDICCRMFIV